jgi:uncharacterized membrane protein YdjX (TVP38/TMEM64 family)
MRRSAGQVERYLLSRPGASDRADWAVLRAEDEAYLGEVVLNELDAPNESMKYHAVAAQLRLGGQRVRIRHEAHSTTGPTCVTRISLLAYRGMVSRRTQLILAFVLLTALVAAALTLPVPSPAELRTWASGAGTATPLLFLLVYAVLTVAPIPRTVFSLAAGLLLGNGLGIVIAMLATATSAALGFLLARLLGRGLVTRHLHRGAVRSVNDRLTGGGVLAVTSLRLIPVIPFAPLSYCCGMSSIRMAPYLAGTVLGSLPGTAAVVLLGDALTGSTPPALVACYGAFALVGAIGLYRVVRTTTTTTTAPVATEATPAISEVPATPRHTA